MNDSNNNLFRSIVNAFDVAYLAASGRDSIFCSINEKTSHLLVSNIPWDIAKLVGELSKVTNQIFGAAKKPDGSETWAMIHLNQLPVDWEDHANRMILETTVILISSAFEDFLKEVTDTYTSIKAFIKENYPEGADYFNEFRATRNSLVHNEGLADKKYFNDSKELNRVKNEGDKLPLDWNYIYENTYRIVDFANKYTTTSQS